MTSRSVRQAPSGRWLSPRQYHRAMIVCANSLRMSYRLQRYEIFLTQQNDDEIFIFRNLLPCYHKPLETHLNKDNPERWQLILQLKTIIPISPTKISLKNNGLTYVVISLASSTPSLSLFVASLFSIYFADSELSLSPLSLSLSFLTSVSLTLTILISKPRSSLEYACNLGKVC